MTETPEWPSRRSVFWTQIITWSILFVIFAVRGTVKGDEVVPTCPSVLDSIGDSGGIPFNLAGASFGIAAIGVLWYLSGWLAALYVRFPGLGSIYRSITGRVMGPMARRMGLIVFASGIALGFLTQLGCNLTG